VVLAVREPFPPPGLTIHYVLYHIAIGIKAGGVSRDSNPGRPKAYYSYYNYTQCRG
jgi:hypothetical protein